MADDVLPPNDPRVVADIQERAGASLVALRRTLAEILDIEPRRMALMTCVLVDDLIYAELSAGLNPEEHPTIHARALIDYGAQLEVEGAIQAYDVVNPEREEEA